MKAPLKKSLILIGTALFFVLVTYAQYIVYTWDKKVPEFMYCENGYFVKKGETDTKVYGYCVCPFGYWGQRCEFEE